MVKKIIVDSSWKQEERKIWTFKERRQQTRDAMEARELEELGLSNLVKREGNKETTVHVVHCLLYTSRCV